MGDFRGSEERDGAAVVYHGSLFRERERFAVVEDMKKKCMDWERRKSTGARRGEKT